MGTITSGKDFQYLKDYQQRLLVWTIDTQHRVELFLWTMIMKKNIFTPYLEVLQKWKVKNLNKQFQLIQAQ